MSKITRRWLDLELQTQLTGMQYDIYGLTGAVNNLEQDTAGLTGAVNNLEACCTGAQYSIAGLTGAVNILENTVTGLVNDAAGFTGAINDLEACCTGAQQSIAGLTGAVNDLTNDVSGLTGAVNDLEACCTGAQQSIAGLTGAVNDLEDKVENLTAADIDFVPVTGIDAGDVQEALEDLKIYVDAQITGVARGVGVTGATGETGVKGVTGLGTPGYTGIQGTTGVAALGQMTVEAFCGYSGLSPTGSIAWYPVTGLNTEVLLGNPSRILGLSTINFKRFTSGDHTAFFYMDVSGSQGPPTNVFIDSSKEYTVILEHISPELSPGAHTVQVYWKTDDPNKITEITEACLESVVLEGALGATGVQGDTGVIGIQGPTGAYGGPPGATGPYGPTGIAGPTGPGLASFDRFVKILPLEDWKQTDCSSDNIGDVPIIKFNTVSLSPKIESVHSVPHEWNGIAPIKLNIGVVLADPMSAGQKVIFKLNYKGFDKLDNVSNLSPYGTQTITLTLDGTESNGDFREFQYSIPGAALTGHDYLYMRLEKIQGTPDAPIVGVCSIELDLGVSVGIGPTGYQGHTGVQGTTGVDGLPYITTLEYNFEPNTDIAFVGNGELGLNNTNPSQASKIYFDADVDATGPNISAIKLFYDGLQVGDVVRISNYDDTTENNHYVVTAKTSQVVGINIVYILDVVHAGLIPYETTNANYNGGSGKVYIRTAVLPGATGLPGYTGVQGITGPAGGPVGSQGETGVDGPSGATGVAGLGVTGLIGPTGIQGTTGPAGQGDTGLQGLQGDTGPDGIQGDTGLIGETGLVGQTGIQGETGYGLPGSTGIGDTGLPGPTGIKGETGVIGIQGPTGLGVTGLVGLTGIGYTGPQGDTGVIGIQGPTGAYGGPPVATGYPGPTGLGVTGPPGVGLSGLIGETVLQGITGPAGGPVGPDGATGFQGETGLSGVTGLIGETGSQGDTGPVGETGYAGVTGLEGQQGDTGTSGYTGVSGATGVEGTQGDTGLGVTGPVGEAGVTGLRGPTGWQGVTGPEGNGVTGFQGSTGFQGVTGVTYYPAILRNFKSAAGTSPAASELQLNNTNPSLVTQITVNKTSLWGDGALFYGSVAVGGYLRLVDADDFDYWNFYEVINKSNLSATQYVYAVNHLSQYEGYQTSNTNYGAGSQQVYLAIVGVPGIRGATGYAGQTGIQGDTGSQGATGIEAFGYTGLVGTTGVMGATGHQGVTGPTGKGDTGLIGPTGYQGDTGVRGVTGPTGKGETGFIGATGLEGPIGETGASGSLTQSAVFNPVSRYEVVDSTGEQVWLVSSSTVYAGLTWTRVGTNLTINYPNHGHSTGDKVIVRNTNVDHQVGLITGTSTNSFQVSTTNSGDTSGSYGAYSLGFTYSHTGSPKTGGTVSAPSGTHADAQLLSLRIRTGGRQGQTYDLVVPASAVNGAGANTSLADCYVPDINARQDNDNLVAIGVTVNTNISGSYTTFRLGNLGPGSLSRIITLNF